MDHAYKMTDEEEAPNDNTLVERPKRPEVLTGTNDREDELQAIDDEAYLDQDSKDVP